MRTFLLLCTLAAFAGAQNVLLIAADDLGVERLACYGVSPSNANTPTLNGLAELGTLVETAWSAPVCSPTRAMMLTGRYPFRTNVGTIYDPNGVAFLKGSEVTIPEAAPAGVASGLFGKWHLADNNSFYHSLPNTQGFDFWRGTMTSWPTNQSPGDPDYFAYPEITGVDGVDASVEDVTGYATTRTVDHVQEWIGTQSGQWFAAVMLHAPHAPYHAPPAYLHDVDLAGLDPTNPEHLPMFHRAMVEAMDTELERLLQGIDFETTLVIFVGDNGTQVAAYDGPSPPTHAKGSLFEPGVHVPLIVAGPDVPAGVRMSGVVSLVDVFGMALEGLGVPASALPSNVDAIGLLRYMRLGRQSPRSVVFTEQFRDVQHGGLFFAEEAARNSRFKLTRRTFDTQNPELVGDELLVNLNDDPLEAANLLDGVLTMREQTAHAVLSAVLDELGKK